MAGLYGLGLKAGDKVILSLSRNEEFIPAFWGCLLGGIIPAPLAPPASLYSPNPALEKLQGVWHTLGEPLVLVSPNLIEQDCEQPRDHCLISEDKLSAPSSLRRSQPAASFHEAGSTDTAFIQFSSGSVGHPKGVLLSHQNLLSNIRAIESGLALQKDDIGLGWMPLFHDMGLIGYHLSPLHFGINHFLINTMDFVRRPLLWLDSLEKHGATITAAPNFAQALILKRLRGNPLKQWDLSRVRLVLNGAEPISVELMQRFMEKMSGFGLDPQAMFPVYGLAEATLAVAFSPTGETPRIEYLDRRELQNHHKVLLVNPDAPSAVPFTSVGFPVRGCEARIVDESGHDFLARPSAIFRPGEIM